MVPETQYVESGGYYIVVCEKLRQPLSA
jgi:hypothetical protein